MLHKDIYAFTTTFLLFLFAVLMIKSLPIESIFKHHNEASQKISMDFVTVKELLCRVEQKHSQKKSFTKTTKKVETKEIQKIVKKETLLQVKEPLKFEEKVDEKILADKIANLKKMKQQVIQEERAKQIAAAQLSNERNVFLTTIKKKINEHKHYPRVAKRRHIEGSNHVNFTIYKNGSMVINKLSGNKIFYNKSKEAIEESFPIEIPPKIISTFPLELNIDLMYALS